MIKHLLWLSSDYRKQRRALIAASRALIRIRGSEFTGPTCGLKNLQWYKTANPEQIIAANVLRDICELKICYEDGENYE